jgi:outer membrane lipoprotein
MRTISSIFFIVAVTILLDSCAVISRGVKEESIETVPYQTLIRETDKYTGDTVILGGYILETKNQGDESVIKVLQVPLGVGEEPKSKDASQGRFIVSHKGFLDPEVYAKDRKITVAGRVMGTVVERIDALAHPYLKVKSREIYLWPEAEYYWAPYRFYHDLWYYWYPPFYPYPFHRYRYYR